jgi:hypothetical protein
MIPRKFKGIRKCSGSEIFPEVGGRAVCAERVRRGYAVLNPWYNQERFGGRPLGHPTYRMSKDSRDKSMLEKQETLEDAYRVVLRGPRDMVKAKLPEPQSPAVQAHTHGHSVLWPCHRERAIRLSWRVSSARWAIGSEPIQGDERGTYVALERSAPNGTRDRLRGASPTVTESP